MVFSILTYNLFFHKGEGDIQNIIDKYQPDVICLQEVANDASLENTLKINGYKIAHKSASFYKHKIVYHILTCFNKSSTTLDISEYFNLPTSLYEKMLKFMSKKQFPRTFTKTTFRKNSKRITIFNSHLSSWATDIERVRQLTKIFRQTRAYTHPTLITGDFNYPYGRKRLENIISQYNLKEATSSIDYTLQTKFLGFIPIRMKLDYILYKNMNLKSIKLLEQKNSDHLPILAEFVI